MSAAEKYSRQTSFALFSAENPGVAHSGVDLDVEFNAVKVSLDETQANLNLIQRADGRLANLSVGRDQLDSSITIGFESPTPWVTATVYTADTSTVFNSGKFYSCQVTHTSGTFSSDLAAGKWLLIADLSVATALGDGDVTTNKLANFAVTNGKLGNGAVDSTKLATNAVTTTKITDASVTTAKISDANVTTAKIADSNVTTAKIANSNVTYAKLQNVSATSRLLGRGTAGAGVVEEISTTGKVEFAGGLLNGKLPRSYIAGCTLANNATDATNDIDIAAGECRDATDTVNITVGAMTKRLDANWSAGTNGGMRLSTLAITNTTYHIFAVAKADLVADFYAYPDNGANADTASFAAGVVTALQAETGGAAYLYARRIGSILRTSGAIVAFTQYGDYFQRSSIVQDVSATNPGTSAVTRTLSVPLGVVTEADVIFYVQNTANNDKVYGFLSALTAVDQTPFIGFSQIGPVAASSGNSLGWAAQARVMTNASGQIRSRISFSDGSIVVCVNTRGWTDRRGKDV